MTVQGGPINENSSRPILTLSKDDLLHTEFMSWRSSKTLTIHLSTLIVTRPGEAIKAFYKVTWHKNTGRKERGGLIPKENLSVSLFLPLLFHLVCMGLQAHILDWMCAQMCWGNSMCSPSGWAPVSRSLSAITHVHLHTLWASVGMKRGLWLRLICEGRTLNTTVNNKAIWVVHTKLNFRG